MAGSVSEESRGFRNRVISCTRGERITSLAAGVNIAKPEVAQASVPWTPCGRPARPAKVLAGRRGQSSLYYWLVR